MLDSSVKCAGTPREGVVLPQRPGPMSIAFLPAISLLMEPIALATSYFSCSLKFKYVLAFISMT